MIARTLLSTSLLAGLLMALAIPAAPADARDRCARQNPQAATADRCLVVTIRPTPERTASDFGQRVGEPYDAQGNPVDRHGNIVAVSDDRSGGPLQVFARER